MGVSLSPWHWCRRESIQFTPSLLRPLFAGVVLASAHHVDDKRHHRVPGRSSHERNGDRAAFRFLRAGITSASTREDHAVFPWPHERSFSTQGTPQGESSPAPFRNVGLRMPGPLANGRRHGRLLDLQICELDSCFSVLFRTPFCSKGVQEDHSPLGLPQTVHWTR